MIRNDSRRNFHASAEQGVTHHRSAIDRIVFDVNRDRHAGILLGVIAMSQDASRLQQLFLVQQVRSAEAA